MDDITQIKQGTDEWRAARLGKVTASRVHCLVDEDCKRSTRAGRENYLFEKVLERLTGEPQDNGFISREMQWGLDHEAEARDAYAPPFSLDRHIIQVGFVQHPTIAMAGASPDGLVGDDGMVEIKCPMPKEHWNTLRHLKKPSLPPFKTEYKWQIQFGLACTGRKWCDFVSYDPRFPPHKRLAIVRVERSDIWIAKLENEVRAFLAKVEDELQG